ncbi:MAG: hypothetical protein TREMPRED_001360 [Tremellales sp. Tagirdzhanova-0007]|nr:MAG: hypothetical protein TREMPRED_001360 [Tremellales sp. Tagirdzhanova-0007]
MSLFLRRLHDHFSQDDAELSTLPSALAHQAAESLGSARVESSEEWIQQRLHLDSLLSQRSDDSLCQALKTFGKIVDTLDMYAPMLKGLHEVHAYTCEKLESLVLDRSVSARHGSAAAYLHGQATAMSTSTAEAVATTVDNLLLRGDAHAANLVLCVLLGVERSNTLLFETNLPVFLRQVQVVAFAGKDIMVARESLLSAMRLYSPSEKATMCPLILQSTHAIFAASLKLCETMHTQMEGLDWVCFIIQHTPMMLRLDLRAQCPDTCNPVVVFATLHSAFPLCTAEAQIALCGALPILTTWDTSAFCCGSQVERAVLFMLALPEEIKTHAMDGLGQLASVVLHQFEPFLSIVSPLALDTVKQPNSPKHQKAAQRLLGRLLAALGPITLDTFVEYLHCSPSMLLADIGLLEMIATLLPNLARRTIQTLTDIVDDLMSGKSRSYEHQTVLHALSTFPLDDPQLGQRAQRLVLWSLHEEKGKQVVMAALQLALNPHVATSSIMRRLTFQAAQLLLADDPQIVHVALSVLSNPGLAGMLDERSCSMILLALHQSLEPSIQIVAAKLLTHLATAHRAIVQPLAWSHIRQSLSLMDFLQTVDPTRAIIEACIISNLLPALPPSLHQKYVGPVKELILSGLQRSSEGHTLSLIFQGLANLAQSEGWGSAQQSELAIDLLEMSQEIPKDSQHAALHAIARLLSVPKDGLDVYNLLITVHATFGGRHAELEPDLKALVSGIYGHLGTVERNPVISRDSKAAIDRENSVYTSDSVSLSQVAEVRDRSGAESETHINWLVTKNLINAMVPAHKASEDRAIILEIMTSLGILQPSAISTLIPDLPLLIMRELRLALRSRDTKRDSTPVGATLLFLASALHTSPSWLQEYWMEAAEMMAECITTGEALSVLRGLDVVLSAVSE